MTTEQAQAVQALMTDDFTTAVHALRTIHKPDWEYAEDKRGWFTFMVGLSEDVNDFGKCMQMAHTIIRLDISVDIVQAIEAIQQPQA